MVGPALKKLAPKLHIFIPAMTRTALDEAGRALGDALVIAGLCDEIKYENREGKGGALPALGVSSRRSSHGIKSVREQGMDVDMFELLIQRACRPMDHRSFMLFNK